MYSHFKESSVFEYEILGISNFYTYLFQNLKFFLIYIHCLSKNFA